MLSICLAHKISCLVQSLSLRQGYVDVYIDTDSIKHAQQIDVLLLMISELGL